MLETTSPDRFRPASMTDVAKRAGVSQKTVSRVVNDEPHVTAAVRDRVRAAIDELGFRPNGAARSLKLRRSRRVGLVTIGTDLYGPTAILQGVEQACRSGEYSLSIVRTLDGTVEELQPAVDSLITQDVEAIVFSEPIEGQMHRLRVPSGIVTLTIGPPDGGDRQGSFAVGIDERSAAATATAHLLSLGHVTVAHIAGPSNWTSSERRSAGWSDALASVSAPTVLPVEGDWSPRSGYAAMTTLLRDRSVTAVFAANDQMAVGAMAAIHAQGLSVPDDVSVVGFDDMPIVAFLATPLTTIRQDFAVAADLAMGELFLALEGEPPTERHRTLPGELIIRSTTARPVAERL